MNADILNDEWQRNIASAIDHQATMLAHTVAERATTPSVLYRPSLSIDGDQWCALYGDNLQDGVAGFGKSPGHAMADFDRAWWSATSTHQADKDKQP